MAERAYAAPPRLGSRAEAEGYVAMVCFKHGPPRLHGVELEWTVHHADDPRRPLDAAVLRSALGAHAPTTLEPHHAPRPLDRGSLVTVEPGGQVEISTPATDSLPRLIAAAAADAAQLAALLDTAGLTLGQHGLDPHRVSRRILTVPRYAAMEAVFDRIGPAGRRMMCSTAALQICLDAGESATEAATRWQAVHALGPPLVALFANSGQHAGVDTGWASGRVAATFGTCPPFSEPPAHGVDPVTTWVSRAMEAPVLCVRRDDADWHPPPGLTFADWLAGPVDARPTLDDLDYHLSTLFPPVRPRGYLEVRYLDAQPDDGWIAPLSLLAALMSDGTVIDAVLEVTEPVAGRWLPAARHGLADPALRRVAAELVALGATALHRVGLDPGTTDDITTQLERKVAYPPRRRAS